MSNSYTNFSLSFKVTPKACEWIETLLAKASSLAGDDTDDKDIQEVFSNWDFAQCMGFEWEIEAAMDKKGKPVHTMWIHDSGGEGDCASVADFIQAYLAKFAPKSKVGFEYANTESKPLIGAFGGGAVVVTAKKQKWMNTGTWLEKELSK